MKVFEFTGLDVETVVVDGSGANSDGTPPAASCHDYQGHECIAICQGANMLGWLRSTRVRHWQHRLHVQV